MELLIDKIYIRPMKMEDASGMALVEKSCFTDPWSEDAFKKAFSDSNYLYFVAEYDTKIIGMAGVIISFHEGYITNVGVLPEYRGNGIAYLILSQLMQKSRERMVDLFSLEVRVSNAKAIALYERLNFDNVGKRPGVYKHPDEDAFVLICDKKGDLI